MYKPVALESPFAGFVAYNVAYGRACMSDCLKRGEAPFASHLLYTQPGVLNDDDKIERAMGIDAGCYLEKALSYTVVYTDLGISKGMEYGIDKAHKCGREVYYRTLGAPWKPVEALNMQDHLIMYKRAFDEALIQLSTALGVARRNNVNILNLGFLFEKLKEYSDRIQMNIAKFKE